MELFHLLREDFSLTLSYNQPPSVLTISCQATATRTVLLRSWFVFWEAPGFTAQCKQSLLPCPGVCTLAVDPGRDCSALGVLLVSLWDSQYHPYPVLHFQQLSTELNFKILKFNDKRLDRSFFQRLQNVADVEKVETSVLEFLVLHWPQKKQNKVEQEMILAHFTEIQSITCVLSQSYGSNQSLPLPTRTRHKPAKCLRQHSFTLV